jgi:hypothetical protein
MTRNKRLRKCITRFDTCIGPDATVTDERTEFKCTGCVRLGQVTKLAERVRTAKALGVVDLGHGFCAYHVAHNMFALYRDGNKLCSATPERVAERVIGAKETPCTS